MSTVRRIHLLPTALQNQIAAGEVVDRPSGVLKELVENSLDAGATDIAVSIEDGGQSFLAVRDNGHGIPAEDLELAVTRYATSKVTSFAELTRVASYGFRGEALPSVASVAVLRLESCWNAPPFSTPLGKEQPEERVVPQESVFDGAEGAYIEVRHGEIVASGPSAMVRGTLVEVRDLFANVPARLKFLKTPAAEQKRCLDALIRLALVRQDVAFSLQAGGRELLRLSAGTDIKARLARIWPSQIAASMRPFDLTRNALRVHGLASLPEGAQSKSDRIFLYVNNRSVNNRVLLQAVREAYKGRLTSREYPQVVLFLEMDPSEVDVNVHPAKSEVRFWDERAVFSAVLRAVESGLASAFPHISSEFSGFAEREVGKEVPHREGEAILRQGALPPLYDGGVPPVSAPFASDITMFSSSEPQAFPFELDVPRAKGFWGSLDAPRIVTMQPRERLDEAGTFVNLNEPQESFPLSEAQGIWPALAREQASSLALPNAASITDISASPPSFGAADVASLGNTMTVEQISAFAEPAASGGVQERVAPYYSDASFSERQGGTSTEESALRSPSKTDGALSPAAIMRHNGYPVAVEGLLCLGQVADAYLVIMQGQELWLVDQHAAHERVLLHGFERSLGEAPSQLFMLPVEVPLHTSEQARLQERYGDLVRMGYCLEAGQGTVRVTGVPALFSREQALGILRDILADKTEDFASVLHLLACHAAIKSGQRLTGDEAAGLLAKWLHTPNCRFCPHGRPILIRFGRTELDKLFKRTV